jgi:hypothetical protein
MLSPSPICYTVVTLLLHCCYVTLSPHCCYTIVLLLLQQYCRTIVTFGVTLMLRSMLSCAFRMLSPSPKNMVVIVRVVYYVFLIFFSFFLNHIQTFARFSNSVAFPCCYTFVTLVLHYFYTVVTLWLHYCYICCYIAITLLLRSMHSCTSRMLSPYPVCNTVVTLVLHCCDTVATLLLRCSYPVVMDVIVLVI